MEKETARKIMDGAISFDHGIGVIDEQISLMEDGKEKDQIISAISEIMKIITFEIILPIERIYPDLNRDK